MRMPVRVAGEIISTSPPSRSSRRTSRQIPTRTVSVNAAASASEVEDVWSSGSPAIVAATRTAIVEVVDTLRARPPPRSA